MNVIRAITVVIASLMLFSNQAVAQPKTLKLVTWNIEHLAEKEGKGCKPRTDGDYSTLKKYAASLDADIIALQEVESEKAVRRVFPAADWDVVMSTREDKGEDFKCRRVDNFITSQKVAIVIRKGVDYSYEPKDEFSSLGLDYQRLRHGVVIKLNHTQPATEVLAVHLKSGCFVDDYRKADKIACEVLSKQAPILDQWIESRINSETPFVIMGDFNHHLNEPQNALWQKLSTMNGKPVKLRDATLGKQSCHPKYKKIIDHIVFGPNTNKHFVADSTFIHYFGKLPGQMEWEDMLSDHCPVSAEFMVEETSKEIETSVRFTRVSKEYQAQTYKTYRLAEEALKAKLKKRNSDKPWVVYMDVDETVLDNSGYQLQLNQKGATFDKPSWGQWVQGRYAKPISGAEHFINTVIELGGKVALITNRNRSNDKYTWANLIESGFDVSRGDICILGRTQKDKHVVEGIESDAECSGSESGYLNDKDLRREQVRQGKAEACWNSVDFPYTDTLKHAWSKKFDVLMEVGDNIQDFTGFRQHCVVPKAVWDTNHKSRLNDADYILLPNAMYGSWGRVEVK